jgi:hypothetical protein
MSFWAQAGFSLGGDFFATTIVNTKAMTSMDRSIFFVFLNNSTENDA